jgi:exodeoxyribonuclease VII small subunit
MKKEAKTNFAADFKELEDIVQWFENNEVDLEEGLKKFERGLELAKQCRTRLKDVENKVVAIKAKFSAGETEDQPQLL